ncbi:unnamed protein product [Polarella glacialis]|uniref:Uncharacterized protein n=1 Tax=Polarella glacialis TaxID=89957 RepID=A0A813KA15_POLGL|nr:unnamed protein product [Polarella glacialis]
MCSVKCSKQMHKSRDGFISSSWGAWSFFSYSYSMPFSFPEGAMAEGSRDREEGPEKFDKQMIRAVRRVLQQELQEIRDLLVSLTENPRGLLERNQSEQSEPKLALQRLSTPGNPRSARSCFSPQGRFLWTSASPSSLSLLTSSRSSLQSTCKLQNLWLEQQGAASQALSAKSRGADKVVKEHKWSIPGRSCRQFCDQQSAASQAVSGKLRGAAEKVFQEHKWPIPGTGPCSVWSISLPGLSRSMWESWSSSICNPIESGGASQFACRGKKGPPGLRSHPPQGPQNAGPWIDFGQPSMNSVSKARTLMGRSGYLYPAVVQLAILAIAAYPMVIHEFAGSCLWSEYNNALECLGVVMALCSFHWKRIKILLGPDRNLLKMYASGNGFYDHWVSTLPFDFLVVCVFLAFEFAIHEGLYLYKLRTQGLECVSVPSSSHRLGHAVGALAFSVVMFFKMHVVSCLDLMIDDFSSKYAEHGLAQEGVLQWNLLQATMNSAAKRLEGSFVILFAATFAGFATVAADLLLGSVNELAHSALPACSGGQLIWVLELEPLQMRPGGILAVHAGACLTEKCIRTRCFVNSLVLDNCVLDAERSYLVRYIDDLLPASTFRE